MVMKECASAMLLPQTCFSSLSLSVLLGFAGLLRFALTFSFWISSRSFGPPLTFPEMLLSFCTFSMDNNRALYFVPTLNCY